MVQIAEQVDQSRRQFDILSLASMLLHDDGLDISAEKLDRVISMSGNRVESQITSMFAKAMTGQNIDVILSQFKPQSRLIVPAEE